MVGISSLGVKILSNFATAILYMAMTGFKSGHERIRTNLRRCGGGPGSYLE